MSVHPGSPSGTCGSSQLHQSCSTTADCAQGACTSQKCSLVSNGGACTADSQCATGNICVDGQCSVTLYNECNPHDICNTGGFWAQFHLTRPSSCVADSTSSTGRRCMIGGPPGTACTSASDCALFDQGYGCVDGTCKKSYAGQYCDSSSECYSGLCYGTCFSGPPGTQCMSSADCATANGCTIPSGSAVGQCAAAQNSAGSACSSVRTHIDHVQAFSVADSLQSAHLTGFPPGCWVRSGNILRFGQLSRAYWPRFVFLYPLLHRPMLLRSSQEVRI